MRRLVVALPLIFNLSGCAGAYVNTYRGAVILKETVDTAHKDFWSDPLRARAEKCEKEATDLKSLELCLDPFTKKNNEIVVKALASYKTAAEALTAILIAAEDNPDGIDKDALKQAFNDTLAAAKELIAYFPEAQKVYDRLELLLKGLV